MAKRGSAIHWFRVTVLAVAIVSCNGHEKSKPVGTPPAIADSLPTASASPGSTSEATPTSLQPATVVGEGGQQPSGWGAVTFGMTDTEVRAAYPTAVTINPPDDYDKAAALATLRLPRVPAAGLDFAALFLFNKSTQRLSMVLLRRDAEKTSEYEQVLAALTEKYGPPIRSKSLSTASVDRSSAEQEAKTRIGSASAVWVSGKTTVSVEYFEALGTRYLIVSYKPKSEEPNL